VVRFFKTFVAVVLAAAVAAQPAPAALRPCCCVKPVEVATKVESPAAAERPCCAAKQAETARAAVATSAQSCCALKTPAAALVQAGGCCCLKAPPAVPASRDQAKQTAEQAPLVPVLAIVDFFDAASTAHRAAPTSEPSPLSGPPLLALYCIWRK
jgi:hypothetical protein